MQALEATSGSGLQALLAEAVIAAKRIDALAPISLLVDGNHQAIQFRRQLVSQVAARSGIKALVGVQAFTKMDLLEEVLNIAASSWTYAEYRAQRNQEIQEQLAHAPSNLQRFSENLRDLQALFGYFDSFDWLDVETMQKPVGKTTNLSSDLISFVSSVHRALNAQGVQTIESLLKSISRDAGEVFLARIQALLGTTIQVSERFPHELIGFLDTVLPKESLNRIDVILEDAGTKSIPAVLTTAPDPWTEAKNAADIVAKAISDGRSTNRIAVLYSDSVEYSQPLSIAFDDAGIEWHGFAMEEPRASVTARAIRTLIDCFVNYVTTGSVGRVQFLKLIRTGRLSSEATKTSNSRIDRFIRSNSLYSSISTWLPMLDEMFDDLEARKVTEEEELKYGEEESQKLARRAVEDSEVAGDVALLVRYLLSAFAPLANQRELSTLSNGLADCFTKLFEEKGFPGTPSDQLVSKRIIDEMRAFPELTSEKTADLAEQVLSMLDSLLSRLKLQHGEMSRGVYIGPVSQNGGLDFDLVLVLGAAEGLLPPKMKQDPLLPDAYKNANPSYAPELPNIHERIDQIQRHLLAITRGAKDVYFSLSIGGLISANTGELTRFSNHFDFSETRTISGTRRFRLESDGSASTYVQATRANLLNNGNAKVTRSVESALSFARPVANAHFGIVDTSASGEVFDFAEKNLSASAVETFLNCGQAFFVTKVLGFPVQDEPEEILNVRALDVGNILHHAFQRLMEEHAALTPSYGEAYSLEAQNVFSSLVHEEADKRKAIGLAGWIPKFDDTISSYIGAIGKIFEAELSVRTNPGQVKGFPRKSDAMAPAQAEFGWHAQSGSPHLIQVTSDDGKKATMRFVGYIDRLNRSESNSSLTVLDFKTGLVPRTSKKTRVQDLLYASAIRAKSPFLGVPVTKVSSLYLVLKPSDVKVVDLRADLYDGLTGVWLDPTAGGLSGAEYVAAAAEVAVRFSNALNDQLSKLLTSANEGSFLTTKYSYCPCCELLGKRVAERLQAHNSPASEDEDE
jgi:RecB family exonuclease